jgi:hypothetical protein
MTSRVPWECPAARRRSPRATGSRCASATARAPRSGGTGRSATTTGSPLRRANPLWLRGRFSRTPATPQAAAWIPWRAIRGARRSPGAPVHPRTTCQGPSRRGAGIRSPRPTLVPRLVSARSCRTPRARLVGSHGAGCTRFVGRGVSMGGAGFGRERDRFFWQANVCDDPIDASKAAGEAGRRQGLRDDGGGSVGGEAPMPHHLTHSLSATAGVALRAPWPAGERRRPLEARDLQTLRGTLRGAAELFRGLLWSTRAALPLKAPQKLLRDGVITEHRKRASRANERLGLSRVGTPREAPPLWRTEEQRPRRPRERRAAGRSTYNARGRQREAMW